MKPHIVFLACIFGIHSIGHCAPSCSRTNLNRCLDSVCALNVSSNPAARCQYCGTSNAGTPPTKNAMRNLSVGTSSKYTISDKELKQAPSDPGQRYVWATQQCLKKLPACTPDDVTESYDKLIEQSCKAAGISAKMSALHSQQSKTKSLSACTSEITICLTDASRCGTNYKPCESDANFDKFFSSCSVLSSGCNEHISAIRDELLSIRNATISGADTQLARIIASYQNTRENKLAGTKSACRSKTQFNNCVNTVCKNNMPHQCGDISGLTDTEIKSYKRTELTAAEALCKFHTLACDALD